MERSPRLKRSLTCCLEIDDGILKKIVGIDAGISRNPGRPRPPIPLMFMKDDVLEHSARKIFKSGNNHLRVHVNRRGRFFGYEWVSSLYWISDGRLRVSGSDRVTSWGDGGVSVSVRAFDFSTRIQGKPFQGSGCGYLFPQRFVRTNPGPFRRLLAFRRFATFGEQNAYRLSSHKAGLSGFRGHPMLKTTTSAMIAAVFLLQGDLYACHLFGGAEIQFWGS